MNRPYIAHFINGIRKEINNVIKLSNEDDVKSQLRETNKSLLDLQRGTETMNMLTKKICKWAEDRELHEADPKAQMLKVTEEIGEIAGALARNDIDATEVEIGDGVVTLTILAMQLGLDINECTKVAYEKIMNRNGEMINGIFVKEEDLSKAK